MRGMVIAVGVICLVCGFVIGVLCTLSSVFADLEANGAYRWDKKRIIGRVEKLD